MISSIRIRRFRSIDDMTIEFGSLTTLVGRNDVGKSNVARALNLFFRGETDLGRLFNFDRDYNRNSTVPEKKAKEITIEVTFKLPSSFKSAHSEVTLKKAWRAYGVHEVKDPIKFSNKKPIPLRSKIPMAIKRHHVEFVPAIKDIRFFASILGDVYDQLSEANSGKLVESGTNFNDNLQESTKGLISGLKEALGEDFTISLPENLRPIFENLDIRNAANIPFDRRGDGVKVRHIPELFQFLSKLKDDNLGTVGAVKASHLWIFEEPENNLEFSAAFEMITRIQNILDKSSNIQLLMTTHSPAFYGMNTLSEETVRKRHFIFQEGQGDKIFSKRREISDQDIDEEMGLLPIIAKAIEPIQEQLASVEKQRQRMEENNYFTKPKIFVEGECDKIAFSRALKLFFPEKVDKLEIVKPDKGGAHSAVNWLYAWQLHQQHRPSPIRAVALLDRDAEGTKVKQKLESDPLIRNRKHIEAFLLEPCGNAVLGLPTGYSPVVDLEALLSDDIWQKAKTDKRLEKRDAQYLADNCFPCEVKKGLLAGNVNAEGRFEGLEEQQQLRLEFKFSKEYKVKISKRIEGMEEEDARNALANLKASLQEALDFLFPSTKTDKFNP